MKNVDIFISVRMALFMSKTKNMTNFMNCFRKGTIVANGDWLTKTRKSSHIRAAAVAC